MFIYPPDNTTVRDKRDFDITLSTAELIRPVFDN